MQHIKRVQESQQLHAQHPIEQHDGRAQQMHFLNVMPNPAIKTEPRDTSPLSYVFGNVYRLPDQTPSPQPVSPPNPYNHNTSGTPSPYHMGGGNGNGNVNMMSPNHPYYSPGTGGGPGVVNGSPIDFDIYQQQQQQQQQQQHPGTMNQYSMYSPSSQPATAQQWPGPSHFKQPMPNNINNLINFNVNNPLTESAGPSSSAASASATASSAQLNPNNNGLHWNDPTPISISNNSFKIEHMLANTQHNHHHQQQNNNQGAGAGASSTSASTNNNEAPSVISLLNIDSDQLMEFNSAELTNLSLS